MELIHGDVPNIVCIQPFGCLPNHIVGKGVIKEIRREHPEANIVAIDYDPGASEVNQLNRIKLMLSTAQKNLKKQQEKLEKNLGGIKEMQDIPDMIFVVDPRKERICIQEAETLGIPLVGICDTNCDPEELDYVIPGNDDAIRAVKLIVSKMADAVIEGNQGQDAEVAEEEAAEEAEA